MKHSKIIETFPLVLRLSEYRLPLWANKKLYKLRQQMAPVWEFRIEEERKMLTEFDMQPAENGVYKFKNNEDMAEWKDRVFEMDNLEEEVEPIQLPLTKTMKDMDALSTNDMIRLEGVIDFVDE